MGAVSLQMISGHVSSDWWKALVRRFVQVGDNLEIRCWREESAEIQQASLYGNPTQDHYEVSIQGTVTEELLTELLSEAPTDKSIYNKMTKYFTINIDHGARRFCSAHYGTEMYLLNVSEEDIAFFQRVMAPYPEDFSISVDQ